MNGGNIEFIIQKRNFSLNFFVLKENFESTFSFGLILIFFCIFLFSLIYFKNRKDFLRFFFILIIFFFSILILIFHNRGLILFLGWDGLGVSSYILVCYYINWKSLNGGIITLLTNRIGDICFFWFLTCISIFSSPLYSFYSFLGPILIFLVGSFTKRAQRPFRSWLPQAIRAPTPVSSLVHRSTLVTAGIYICIKYFIFFSNIFFLFFISIFGFLTIFFSGFISIVEKDIKKIVALRTLSQMGLLVFSLGLIIPTYTFFHLIIHAIFKRCIFLQIGFFIQASYGNQDTRFFSATYLRSILRRFFFFSCTLSLCGLFFSSGFLRKDIIISIGYYSGLRFLFQVLFFFCIFFTYLYTIRLIIFLVGTTQISIYTFFSQIPIFFLLSPF